jgi:hypothetical protein
MGNRGLRSGAHSYPAPDRVLRLPPCLRNIETTPANARAASPEHRDSQAWTRRTWQVRLEAPTHRHTCWQVPVSAASDAVAGQPAISAVILATPCCSFSDHRAAPASYGYFDDRTVDFVFVSPCGFIGLSGLDFVVVHQPRCKGGGRSAATPPHLNRHPLGASHETGAATVLRRNIRVPNSLKLPSRPHRNPARGWNADLNRARRRLRLRTNRPVGLGKMRGRCFDVTR